MHRLSPEGKQNSLLSWLVYFFSPVAHVQDPEDHDVVHVPPQQLTRVPDEQSLLELQAADARTKHATMSERLNNQCIFLRMRGASLIGSPNEGRGRQEFRSLKTSPESPESAAAWLWVTTNYG